MDEPTSAPRTCEVCGRKLYRNNTSGICNGNGATPECKRRRQQRYRETIRRQPRSKELCRHPDGCPGPARSVDGLCNMHAARLAKTGELGPVESLVKPIVIRPGDTFGLWTALETYDRSDLCVLCRCACGTERRVKAVSLNTGHSGSCGCLNAAQVKRPRAPGGIYLRSGDTSGRLTVLESVEYARDLVLCRCECGTEKKIRAMYVKIGHTKSCGCLSRKHGLSKHPLYGVWYAMISRTTNPADKAYAEYGGRGISTCKGWQGMPDGFRNFLADVGERPPGLSLDREDNDGGYWCGRCADCTASGRPANVTWKTPKQQNANRRSVPQLTRERDAARARVAELEAEVIVLRAVLAAERGTLF